MNKSVQHFEKNDNKKLYKFYTTKITIPIIK